MDALFPALHGMAVLLFLAFVAVGVIVVVKLCRLAGSNPGRRETRTERRVRADLARQGFIPDEIEQAQRDA